LSPPGCALPLMRSPIGGSAGRLPFRLSTTSFGGGRSAGNLSASQSGFNRPPPRMTNRPKAQSSNEVGQVTITSHRTMGGKDSKRIIQADRRWDSTTALDEMVAVVKNTRRPRQQFGVPLKWLSYGILYPSVFTRHSSPAAIRRSPALRAAPP